MKTGNILADFEWQRAEDGYCWRRVGGRLLMVPAQRDGRPLRAVTYKPFAKAGSAMFMEFAALDAKPKSHLAFANRYGQLGFPLRMLVRNEGSQLDPLPPQETANAWSPEDWTTLGPVGEFFALRGTENDDACWSAQSLLIDSFVHPPPLNPSMEGDDGAPETQSIMNRVLQDSVRVFFSWSEANMTFDLRMKPISLIGAMWLQTALSMTGTKAFRQCPVCERPIEISRGAGARPDAVYCSNACRTKNSRQRRKEARQLLANGENLKQVAKRLGTDLATLRGWLA